jgi:hypothetical protein
MRSTNGKGSTGKERINNEEEISANKKSSNFQTCATINGSVSGGEDSNMVFHEKILPPKGNNIYVGQWDSIKEKMTWQAVEKGAEMMEKLNMENTTNHVVAKSPTAITDKQTGSEKGPIMPSDVKKEKIAGNRAGKKMKTNWGTADDTKGAKGQAGKRKMQGENYETVREGGKKNKTNVEGHEVCNSVSAGAVQQPRQSK